MSEDTTQDIGKKKRGPKGASKPLTTKDFNKLISMIRIQCTQEECCNVLEMSDTTLNRRLKEMGYQNFEDLHRQFNSEGRMSLRRMQWQAAENGNASVLVWLGKQYLNQKDKTNVEVTGEDGGAIISRIERVIVDPTN